LINPVINCPTSRSLVGAPATTRSRSATHILEAAQRQHPLGAFGNGGQPQLDQPAGLHRRPRIAGEVHERMSDR